MSTGPKSWISFIGLILIIRYSRHVHNRKYVRVHVNSVKLIFSRQLSKTFMRKHFKIKTYFVDEALFSNTSRGFGDSRIKNSPKPTIQTLDDLHNYTFYLHETFYVRKITRVWASHGSVSNGRLGNFQLSKKFHKKVKPR